MATVFDPLRFGAVSMDVLTSSRAPASTLAARQQARLQSVLSSALAHSRFYAAHLRGAMPDTALGALPSVTRETLMAHFDDWVVDPQLTLGGLRAFTADCGRIGEPYLGKYLVWESSGTSCQSGVFVQDTRAMAVYDALEAHRRSTPRPLQRWLDPLMLTERIAFVGATSGHFASYVTVQRLRELNPCLASSMRSFSILQSTTALVEQLNTFMPTVVATYPTVAALLAQEARCGALRARPTEVWTGGETLSPVVRREVEQALGCTVRNSYGASEFMSIAWECSHGHLHLNADWVILEPVDQSGRPTPAGALSHTTLLTNLANHVQPLIRYDLGDQIALHGSPCACGCTLPVIEVLGRRDDPLRMAGRDGRLLTVLPLALTTVLEDQAGVFDFQVCQQDAHTLVLRLSLQGREGEAAFERCRSAIKQFSVAQALGPIRLIAELGQVIPRGNSGKAKRIVALT